MKCNNCDYTTENKKSFSNHIRNGCRGNKPSRTNQPIDNLFIKPFNDRKFIPKRPETKRSELSKLSNYKDRLKYMDWKDCLVSQEILARYINDKERAYNTRWK